jgi:hypothetical protein
MQKVMFEECNSDEIDAALCTRGTRHYSRSPRRLAMVDQQSLWAYDIFRVLERRQYRGSFHAGRLPFVVHKVVVRPFAILRYAKVVKDVHGLPEPTPCLEVGMSLRVVAIRFVLQQEIHDLLLPRIPHEPLLLRLGLRLGRLVGPD